MTGAANNQKLSAQLGPTPTGTGSGNLPRSWGGHPWGALPPVAAAARDKGPAIVAMILGFIFCWPIGSASWRF